MDLFKILAGLTRAIEQRFDLATVTFYIDGDAGTVRMDIQSACKKYALSKVYTVHLLLSLHYAPPQAILSEIEADIYNYFHR